MMKRLLGMFTAVIMTAVCLNAQVTTATVVGIVSDESGEPAVGATVRALHTPSGTYTGATTRSDGRYTLANLRALIAVDPDRAQHMLDRLIDFLRATLGGSRAPLHPLSSEFSRLADYLALMQVRMGDRLKVELDLPPALASVAVPPMLLQPLVENAIKHGLEPRRAGGLIQVSARREGPELVIRVADTGAGLAASAGNPASPGTGFGVGQVRERLATQFGAASSLTLEPGPPEVGGTLATLRWPQPEDIA